uniref:FBA_2 domain-containing protein n=2 Tax=Caenorhabditis tropicalis TaxID=1561998 RepID=A0A1I7U4H4_9PELO
MKILKFPYVIQVEIIRQMTFGEAFLLSLATRKSMEMVQRVGWRNEKHITYMLTQRNLTVLFRRESSKPFRRNAWYYEKEDPEWRKQILFRFPGSDVQYKIEIHGRWHYSIIFWGEHMFSVMEACHSVTDKLFGRNSKYKLILDRLGVNWDLSYIGNHETHIDRFNFYNNAVRYFETIPIQKYVSTLTFNAEFPPESRFFDTYCLSSIVAFSLARQVLRHFRGRAATLHCGMCETADVAQFLSRWKVGGQLPNLETLRIDQIYSEYIVRSDGIVAFISIKPQSFYFHVTGFTEDQMMERKLTEFHSLYSSLSY